MLFWWVNHKQTFKEEVEEGYIWSPKKKKDGSDNPTYDNLTRVRVGDIIFSYASTKIAAVGTVLEKALDRDRPAEFGSTGDQWDEKGWLVPVKWVMLPYPLLPKEHLSAISPLLPERYSPLQASTGNGNQAFYLTAISNDLGRLLMSLIEQIDAGTRYQLQVFEQNHAEDALEDAILHSEERNTQKEQLIQARQGQGIFRRNVELIESKCRVTGVTDKRLLIASHIKPWKDSSNKERLDGYNGFLLSPHIDKLFDNGWISFSLDGELMVRQKQIEQTLQAWSIDVGRSVGGFTGRQKEYLLYHQTHVFKS